MQGESNKKEYSFSWFLLFLVIIADIILFTFMIFLKFNIQKTGELIGFAGLAGTFVAIFYAWGASREHSGKLDDIQDLINKSNSKTYQTIMQWTDRQFGKQDLVEIRNKHFTLELEIIRLLDTLKIHYSREKVLKIDNKRSVADFVIYINNKKIPIELKVYTKKILLPASRGLISRLVKQLVSYMDSLKSDKSILIIWNPHITREAKQRLEHLIDTPTADMRIKVIQSHKVDVILRKLSDYIRYLQNK